MPRRILSRHSNNERAAFVDSLELFCQKFLSQAREASKRNEGLDGVGGLPRKEGQTLGMNELLAFAGRTDESEQPRMSHP